MMGQPDLYGSFRPQVYVNQPWDQNYLNPQGADPYGFNTGYNLGLQPQDF